MYYTMLNGVFGFRLSVCLSVCLSDGLTTLSGSLKASLISEPAAVCFPSIKYNIVIYHIIIIIGEMRYDLVDTAVPILQIHIYVCLSK